MTRYSIVIKEKFQKFALKICTLEPKLHAFGLSRFCFDSVFILSLWVLSFILSTIDLGSRQFFKSFRRIC